MPDPIRPAEWDSHLGGRFRRRGPDELPPSAGTMGMVLFLIALSVLFLASLVGYLIVRHRAGTQWVPEGAGEFPGGLWLSTAMIGFGSVAIQRSLVAIRRGRQGACRQWLWVTLGAGLLFLALQGWNWMILTGSGVTPRTGLYGFTFYLFTTLHALHVIAGLIQLLVVIVYATRGEYGTEHHPGVRNSAMYWHFLAAVWLVLFVTIVFT